MIRKLIPVILLCLLPLWALADVYGPVYMTLNKKSGIYAAGDTAVVYASTTKPGEALKLKVTENGRTIVEKEITLTGSMEPVFSQACDSTKWIMARIEPAKDPVKNVYTAVGYIVDPQNFRPAFDAPEDLHEYWDSQVKTMRRSRLKVLEMKKVDTPEKYAGQLDCWHVILSMPEGRPVNGYLAIPSGAKKKTLPIVLSLHGATAITSKATQSNLNSACAEAARGTISMNINAHGMEDGADEGYYKELEKELKQYYSRPLVDKESYYFRLMYLRGVRALDFLVKRPEWDGKRILTTGGSQGGGQALSIAGIDPRVTHVRARVPAISDMGGWLKNRQSGWPYGSKKKFMSNSTELATSILPYFDGAILIRDFKGALCVEVGFIDITCSPCAVYSVFNNATTEDKAIFAYPYRRHFGVDKRYNKKWSEKRNEFSKEFDNKFYNQ